MSIGVIFLILLHAAPIVLAQNDTQLLDDEPPGESYAPAPSFPTPTNFYDDFGPGGPPAPTPEPSSPPSPPPPPPTSTTPAPAQSPEPAAPSGPPPPPESNPADSEPDLEPELEQPVEPFPVSPPDSNKLDKADYSEAEYEDLRSRSGGAFGTRPPVLPKFTVRSTTTTTTTRAPELIGMEQDYIPPPVSSSHLKIPKFDVPRSKNERYRVNGGGPPPPRGSFRDREPSFKERPWDRETGYTENKIPFGRTKNLPAERSASGYIRDSNAGGYKLDEEEELGSRRGSGGKKDGKSTTKLIMLGIVLASVFAAMLVIFILTFLLMDRIVALA